MYRTKLRPAGDHASYPLLHLPKRYDDLVIDRIVITDHAHPKYEHLVHLTIDNLTDAFRISVTVEPHPRWWIPSRRRSYPRSQAPDGQPSSSFAEEIGRLRYARTPEILRGINGLLDHVFLGRQDDHVLAAARRILGHGRRTSTAYGPDGFTWVPPDGPFDFRSRAYRNIDKVSIVEESRALGPVDVVNAILGPPAYIRYATADVTFR